MMVCHAKTFVRFSTLYGLTNLVPTVAFHRIFADVQH